MTDNIKFYKLKLIKKLLHSTSQARSRLLEELVTEATNPTIVKRRIRMIKHLNSYETQLLDKIQNFQTNDAVDLLNFDPTADIKSIINRSA